MLADFLEAVLQDIGHSVCGIAGGVDDAVRLVREHRPDIALLDMQLGGGEYGTDVADRPAAPGVAASGQDHVVLRVWSPALPA